MCVLEMKEKLIEDSKKPGFDRKKLIEKYGSTACNDKSAAHWHCKDCKKNICNACQKAHLRVKITKNHSLTFLNK